MGRWFKFFVFLFLTLAACLGLGMSAAPQQPQQTGSTEDELTKTAVEEAIADIDSAFESRDVAAMMDCLDKDFEGWLEFKSSIQNKFLSVKELQVFVVVDTFLSENDKVSVNLHWFKKTIDNSGAFSKTEGRSQFVFKSTPGGLKLLYTRGDNMFY